jgi:hypothetical protein
MRIIQTGRAGFYRKTCPAILFATIATVACGDSTSPRDTTFDNPTGTYQASMVAVVGLGEGGMSITPKAIPEGYFAADIKVRIRKARANATYVVQRAPEVGRILGNDGVCERALSVAPWSSTDAPAPAFITFIPFGATTTATFTTSASGDGMLDFEFRAAVIPKDTKFDVMFRIVDDAAAPASVLLSQCVTVTVI